MNSLSIFALLLLTASSVDSPNLRRGTTDVQMCEEVAVEINTAVNEGYLSPEVARDVIDNCWSSVAKYGPAY